jgi:2-phosphosulfolactate phosphatase
MDIRILQLLDGAKAARGLTVIIDVFRAYSVEAYLLHMGAEKIIPLADENMAYKLKEQNPDMLLAGERGGAILPGFDTGNSPSQLAGLDVKGKTVIHTTSAGTQGIANALGADEILGGSLLTADATVEYIRRSGAEVVSLVCMGLAAKEPTEEDTLCARYIKAKLEGEELDFPAEVEIVKNTSGAKFFDPAQQKVFPNADFHMCLQPGKFNFVLKYEQPENGLGYIRPLIMD